MQRTFMTQRLKTFLLYKINPLRKLGCISLFRRGCVRTVLGLLACQRSFVFGL